MKVFEQILGHHSKATITESSGHNTRSGSKIHPDERTERRRFGRFPLNISASLQLQGDTTRRCTISNFSAVGMALLHQPRRIAVDSPDRAQIRQGEAIGVAFELASSGERLRAVGAVKRARRREGVVEIGIEFEHIGLNAYKRLIRISDSTQILANTRDGVPASTEKNSDPWSLVSDFVQSFSDAAITRIGERLLLYAEHAEDVGSRAPYFYALIDLRARSKEISERFVQRLCNRIGSWSRGEDRDAADTTESGTGATVISILSGAAEAARGRREQTGPSQGLPSQAVSPAPPIGPAAQRITRFVQSQGIDFDSQLVHAANAPLAPRTIVNIFLQASEPFAAESPIDTLARETLDELLRLHYLNLTRRLASLG